eukprot:symbB.v1.2.040104.t1/scaffold6993.1/size14019/1
MGRRGSFMAQSLLTKGAKEFDQRNARFPLQATEEELKGLRWSKAKAEAKEVNERWNVIADVVRYIMLVIGWFWFSAEVMDMACLEGGGPWQIIKAVSSPCLFIFILESDRSHFWWQLVAGIVATVLLLDLLFA